MYRFDGSTVLIIKTDVTYTVTHQNDRHSFIILSFSHPPGRKTLSTRATRRRPHSKPLVGQANSLIGAGSLGYGTGEAARSKKEEHYRYPGN